MNQIAIDRSGLLLEAAWHTGRATFLASKAYDGQNPEPEEVTATARVCLATTLAQWPNLSQDVQGRFIASFIAGHQGIKRWNGPGGVYEVRFDRLRDTTR